MRIRYISFTSLFTCGNKNQPQRQNYLWALENNMSLEHDNSKCTAFTSTILSLFTVKVT